MENDQQTLSDREPRHPYKYHPLFMEIINIYAKLTTHLDELFQSLYEADIATGRLFVNGFHTQHDLTDMK